MHPLDDLFRRNLEGFESGPETETWDKINTRLNHKRRRRPMVIVLSFLAGAACMYLIMQVYPYFSESEIRKVQRETLDHPGSTDGNASRSSAGQEEASPISLNTDRGFSRTDISGQTSPEEKSGKEKRAYSDRDNITKDKERAGAYPERDTFQNTGSDETSADLTGKNTGSFRTVFPAGKSDSVNSTEKGKELDREENLEITNLPEKPGEGLIKSQDEGLELGIFPSGLKKETGSDHRSELEVYPENDTAGIEKITEKVKATGSEIRILQSGQQNLLVLDPDSAEIIAKADSAAEEELPDLSEQEEQEEVRSYKGLYLEAFVSPHISYRYMSSRDRKDAVYFRSTDKSKTGFSAGLQVKKPVSEKLLLTGAVSYISIGERALRKKGQDQVPAPPVVGPGPAYLAAADNYSGVWNSRLEAEDLPFETEELALDYSFVGLSLGVERKSGIGNLSFSWFGAVSANILVSERYSYFYCYGRDTSSQYGQQQIYQNRGVNLKKSAFMLSGGFVLNRPLGRMMWISVGPELKLFLNSIYSREARVRHRPYAGGLRVSVSRVIR